MNAFQIIESKYTEPLWCKKKLHFREPIKEDHHTSVPNSLLFARPAKASETTARENKILGEAIADNARATSSQDKWQPEEASKQGRKRAMGIPDLAVTIPSRREMTMGYVIIMTIMT
jgi:hypothetical protein